MLYIFFCGTVAICAMILPGVSGAFLLLILGKYSEMTEAIHRILHGEFTAETLLKVVVFLAGCSVGLLTFSKLLRRILAQYGSLTMAVLCGFMVGSLRKVWPFKIDLTPQETNFTLKQFANVWPDLSDDMTRLSLLLTLGAVAFVIALDRLSRRRGIQATTENDESESPP